MYGLRAVQFFVFLTFLVCSASFADGAPATPSQEVGFGGMNEFEDLPLSITAPASIQSVTEIKPEAAVNVAEAKHKIPDKIAAKYKIHERAKTEKLKSLKADFDLLQAELATINTAYNLAMRPLSKSLREDLQSIGFMLQDSKRWFWSRSVKSEVYAELKALVELILDASLPNRIIPDSTPDLSIDYLKNIVARIISPLPLQDLQNMKIWMDICLATITKILDLTTAHELFVSSVQRETSALIQKMIDVVPTDTLIPAASPPNYSENIPVQFLYMPMENPSTVMERYIAMVKEFNEDFWYFKLYIGVPCYVFSAFGIAWVWRNRNDPMPPGTQYMLNECDGGQWEYTAYKSAKKHESATHAEVSVCDQLELDSEKSRGIEGEHGCV